MDPPSGLGLSHGWIEKELFSPNHHISAQNSDEPKNSEFNLTSPNHYEGICQFRRLARTYFSQLLSLIFNLKTLKHMVCDMWTSLCTLPLALQMLQAGLGKTILSVRLL